MKRLRSGAYQTSSHTRPNANYKNRHNVEMERQKYLENSLTFYEFFTEEELNKLPEQSRKMLKNDTALIKQCIECKDYVLVPRKTYFKLQRFYQKKYGGWCCVPCHKNFRDDMRAESKEKRKLYENAYKKWNEKRNKQLGVKIYYEE